MKYLNKYNESDFMRQQVKLDLTEEDVNRVIDLFELQISDKYKMIFDDLYDPRINMGRVPYSININTDETMKKATKLTSVYTCYYNKHSKCIEIVINKSSSLNNMEFNSDMKLFKDRLSKFGYIVTGHASSRILYHQNSAQKKYYVVIFKPMFTKRK